MKTVEITEKEEMKKELFELYDQSTNWINELEFLQDEQKFLEHLLSSHFLDLSSSRLYDRTRKLIKKLMDVENMGNKLSDTIEVHNKHLATLIESLQYKREKEFKKEHKQIEESFTNYILNFKYVKKKIFGLIKEIMKNHKQKLLLEEQ